MASARSAKRRMPFSLRSMPAHGERIPRFAEAAALCRELGLLANVEIKPATGYEVATAEVVARMTADLWRGRGSSAAAFIVFSGSA